MEDTIVRDVTDDIDDKIFELSDGITPQLTEQELGEFTGIFKGFLQKHRKGCGMVK